jgi:serine/threonine protein kinase/DNA-binding winged helix-turn-helix (wHTH) protein/tetratricopeptide (TPR) repeat protein
MRDTLPDRVRLGASEVDLRSGELREGERSFILTEQPLRVLRLLVERDGEMVTRDELQKKLWPNDTVVDFDHGINAAIRRLRQAFGDSAEAPKYIETVARRGYRLMVPVEHLSVASGELSEAGAPPVEGHGPSAGSGQALSRAVNGNLGPGALAPALADADGTAARMELQSAVLTGRTVSHYRVLDIIGGGGMGVVYRAEDLKLGRQVALKFLPEELGSDPQALERFSREARAASSLDHPNICPIHEFGEHEGRPFMVMQSMEGQTLRDRLAREEKAVPLAELLDIGIQVSDGLRAAHEKGIIHRDIKPANIFLTSKGVVKILDFGLAKLMFTEENLPLSSRAEPPAFGGGVEGSAVSFGSHTADPSAACLPGREDAAGEEGGHSARDDNSRIAGGAANAAPLHPVTPAEVTLTRTGVAMGTAGYMSPEQVRGEKLDARTDIFSFGLVLYEMATGQRAFHGETAAIVHDAILSHTPAPAHELNSAITPKLEQIINHAIEKERERRYQSAAELQGALQSLEESTETGTSRSRSRWTWLAAAAVVCVASVVGILYWRSHRAPKLTEQDTVVIAAFVNKTGDPVFDDTLKQALSVQLSQSPFLNILSNRKIRGALKEMNRSANEPVTADVALEVCRHAESKAVLAGYIGPLEKGYLLELKALDCNTRVVLAEAEERAPDKEAVLKALDEAALTIRRKMGEPLSSVRKYAVPLSEATTPSLEAWKAYSMGVEAVYKAGMTASLPFFKRAVEIDPNFAKAYTALSAMYANLGEGQRSEEYGRKAYERRDKVSERDRFVIEATYYDKVTGEMEEAAKAYDRWRLNYPRDPAPYANLCGVYFKLGSMEKLLEMSREVMRVEPNSGVLYVNLVLCPINT